MMQKIAVPKLALTTALAMGSNGRGYVTGIVYPGQCFKTMDVGSQQVKSYLTSFDTATHKIINTTVLGARTDVGATSVALVSDATRAYVVLSPSLEAAMARGQVAVVDTNGAAVVNTIDVEYPQNIAISTVSGSCFQFASAPTLTWTAAPTYTGALDTSTPTDIRQRFRTEPDPDGGRNATAAGSPSATTVSVDTPTATASVANTPTQSQGSCRGDCKGEGKVDIGDLIIVVDIVLGNLPVTDCPAFEDPLGQVGIAQVVEAVSNALEGCVS
jgi:hypothetical protein